MIVDFKMNFYRENYKTFNELMKIAIGHEKKNYICEINPSCSFSGSKFVIKSSVNMNQRYNLLNYIRMGLVFVLIQSNQPMKTQRI